jgi:thioredoxin-like negative regulator of GroEL
VDRVRSAVAELRREGFQVRSINVRSRPSMAAKYQIYVVPTFVLVRDGEEVRRRTGVQSTQALRRMWSDSWGWF